MGTPLSYASSELSVLAHNRRRTLIVLGVLAIAVGVLMAAAGSWYVVETYEYLQKWTGARAGDYFTRVLLGSGAAILFLFLIASCALVWGVAAARRRRWVRPIGMATAVFMVIWCGMWLEDGIVSDIVVSRARIVTGSATIERNLADLIVSLLAIGLFGVVIPGIIGVALRPRSIRETLEASDRARWTDAVPLPVIMLGVWFAGSAIVGVASMTSTSDAFFGRFVSDWRAKLAICVGRVVLMSLCSILIFRRLAAGWWAGLAVITISAFNTIWTDAMGDPAQMYKEEFYGSAYISVMMEAWPTIALHRIIVRCALWALVVGYMAYYFPLFGKRTLVIEGASGGDVQ